MLTGLEKLRGVVAHGTQSPAHVQDIDRAHNAFLELLGNESPETLAFHDELKAKDDADDALLGPRPTNPFDATQGPKIHRVCSGVYLSSYHGAQDRDTLLRLGVSHVLSCIPDCEFHRGTFEYLSLAAEDTSKYNVASHFGDTNRFVTRAILEGGGVLIHCGAGVSRAPTMAAAALISVLRCSAELALRHVRWARPCVLPNDGFVAQLVAFAASVEDR